jgi:RNA polymerase sigma factor (sigma-70 family)
MQQVAVPDGSLDRHARPSHQAWNADDQAPAWSETSELVGRASTGDQAAWSELVDHYGGLVWAVARRHGLSREDAADVSQVVWLRLVQRLGSLRQPERVGAWLATTTRRESLRVAQVRGREVPVAGEHGPNRLGREVPAPEAGLLAAEREAELWQAFGSLPRRCQQLLRLLLADPPLSYAEVATVLEIPIGSIGPTRARCLGCLRRHLAAQDLRKPDAVGVHEHGPTIGA